MKYKIIVFDLDGTLVDSAQHVSQHFLNRYPTMTMEIMNEMLVGNFNEELEKFKQTNPPINGTDEERRVLSQAYTSKKAELPLYPHIGELLKTLHDKGCRLVVNTSAFLKNCTPVLEKNGVFEMFDYFATKELGNDKGEKFKLVAQHFDVSMTEMVFVTDTLGDVREANTVSVPTIAVTWGAHDRAIFEREYCRSLIQVVDTVQELEGYLLEV